jgi:glycosyltransferase involved in cell wall biosynthesis
VKILFQHNGILPVLKYGGAERILFWHMKALVEQGHEVVLLGNPESKVENVGIELIPLENGQDWRSLVPSDVDVIHLFYNVPQDLDLPKPVVITIQGNGQPREVFHNNTVFLSAKHAANHSSETFVYNGLDFDEYPRAKGKTIDWQKFAFLAKASWKVKNLKDCIRACKKNGKSLDIAGGRGFNFSKKINYHGMVDQVNKIQLLENADALLWPVRWHEPFGIAVIEAMACGCAVISSSYGSLPELVTPEVGIVCNSYEEFENAINGERHFDSDIIRDYVEDKFSIANFTNNYLSFYKRVLRGDSLNENSPKTLGVEHPEKLLTF